MTDLQQALTVGVEAARGAGAIHLAHPGKALTIRSKTTPGDLVTGVDAGANGRLHGELLALFTRAPSPGKEA